MMRYYKFLTNDNTGKFSDYDFTEYLPHNGEPGKWLPKIKNIELCVSGYHCFTPDHILDWLDAQLYEVEIAGRCVQGDDKIVSQQMRFVRKIDAWNDTTARLFACYCARDVLPFYEKKHQNDTRPRIAIDTAERYARGQATIEELNIARVAARAAALVAARDAARAAALDAARAAALDAALVAARDAAWYAARAAALDAARAAALDAAWDKYNNRLLEILGESYEA